MPLKLISFPSSEKQRIHWPLWSKQLPVISARSATSWRRRCRSRKPALGFSEFSAVPDSCMKMGSSRYGYGSNHGEALVLKSKRSGMFIPNKMVLICMCILYMYKYLLIHSFVEELHAAGTANRHDP